MACMPLELALLLQRHNFMGNAFFFFSSFQLCIFSFQRINLSLFIEELLNRSTFVAMLLTRYSRSSAGVDRASTYTLISSRLSLKRTSRASKQMTKHLHLSL